MKSDSLNFAVLVVDSETYAFEGGTLAYYAPCNHCAEDSLPLKVQKTYEGDFGSILFSNAQTGDTLFAATLGWMHPYHVLYPHALAPPDSFETCEPLTRPTTAQWFMSEGQLSAEDIAAAADSVWSAIGSLDLTHALAGRKLRVGYVWYPYFGFDGYEAKWVVFLCRGNR